MKIDQYMYHKVKLNYGKREIASGRYATLIAKFREAMRTKQPLTVVAPGTQTRNFTHVDDIVDALLLIGEQGHGDEYGIGSPEAYSILDLTKLFDKSDRPVTILPERKGNRMSAPVVDIKTRELGWVPTRHLSDWIEMLRERDWIM